MLVSYAELPVGIILNVEKIGLCLGMSLKSHPDFLTIAVSQIVWHFITLYVSTLLYRLRVHDRILESTFSGSKLKCCIDLIVVQVEVWYRFLKVDQNYCGRRIWQ